MLKTEGAFFFPIILLIIGMFSLQSGSSLAKYLLLVTTPLEMTFLRVFIGMLILLTILQPWRFYHQWQINSKNIVMLVGYSLSLVLMNLFFYMAISRIPLGITVALEFVGPLIVTVVKSRNALDSLWILLVAIGVYYLLPIHNNSLMALDWVGVIDALIAGGCWAFYIILGRRTGMVFGSSAVALGLVIGSLALLPFIIFCPHENVFSFDILPLAAEVALLSTAIPYLLEMIAMIRIPTKTFAVLMSLEPVVGAICGIVFLSERLTLIQWIALIMIVVASSAAAITRNQKMVSVES